MSAEWTVFYSLRQRVFDAIKKAISIDPAHKSYEGTFELTRIFPGYFEDENDTAWRVTLHCYVLGNARHYSWTGETFSAALDKAAKDIDQMIGELDDEQ